MNSQPCDNIQNPEPRGWGPSSWRKSIGWIILQLQKRDKTYLWLPWHNSWSESASSNVSFLSSSVGKTNFPSLTRSGGYLPVMSSKSSSHWPVGSRSFLASNLQSFLTFCFWSQNKKKYEKWSVHFQSQAVSGNSRNKLRWLKPDSAEWRVMRVCRLTHQWCHQLITQHTAHLGFSDLHISW